MNYLKEEITDKEIIPTRRQKGMSALSVIALLSLSLVGSLRLREYVCNPNIQSYDLFTCVGIYPLILSHVFIAGKPIRDGIECIFPKD